MRPWLSVYEKAVPKDLDWTQKLLAAKEAGFDGVEISIDETEEKLSRLDWTQTQRRRLAMLMRDTGSYIQTMCLSGHRKYPIGSADKATEARGMEIAQKAIEFSYDTGIRIIQLAGYDVYYEPSDDSTVVRFEENLERVVEMAERCGIILAFETMETSFMNTVTKAMKYVNCVNSPYLQVYPDVGNVTNATDYVAEDIAAGSGHIVAAHLKETLPGIFRNLHYGEGHVDFDTVILQLLSQGVGIFNAEFWYDPQYLNGDWKTALKGAHDYLRPLTERATE